MTIEPIPYPPSDPPSPGSIPWINSITLRVETLRRELDDMTQQRDALAAILGQKAAECERLTRRLDDIERRNAP